MDSNKKYIVPILDFDDYTLSTKIAGVCAQDWVDNAIEWGYFAIAENCESKSSEWSDNPYGGGAYDICYHTIDMLYGS